MSDCVMLGVRAHDFGKQPVEELAKKIAAKGFSYIQLALAKALSGINAESGVLNPGYANYIREVFHKYGIRISVLGCYINPVHPDRDMRKQLLYRFKEHIRYARDFGCSIVATETGSMNVDYSFTPENYSDEALKTFLESIYEMVEEAEKFGVLVGIEGVARHVVCTPERMKEVLDTIKSNNLQVVFDPVNLLSEENYQNQDNIINTSFELFGDRIVALHAKDFKIVDGKVKSVEAGSGSLNYELLFKLLNERKPYVDVLMEDTKLETMDEVISFMSQWGRFPLTQK